jgi:hypothetical protein
MLDRMMSMLLLWGMEGCFAWYIAEQYTAVLNDKFSGILRALNAIH